MNLREAIEAYRRHQVNRRLAERTVKDNNGRLLQFCDFIGAMELSEIAPAQVHDYFIYLRDERGVSEATRANRKSTIRAFFNWCIKAKLIDYEDDPSRILLENNQHKYSYEPKAHQPTSSESLDTVLASIPAYMAHHGYSERSVKDALIVSLTADSAARRKAIWSIRRRDVITALDEGGPTYLIHSVIGKTGSEKVRFFENTASIARMYLNQIPKTAVWLFENPKTGKRLRLDGLRKSFWRLCAFAGVPRFLFQSVRKRNVMDAIKESGDVTIGQKYAGHSTPRTTQVYYNLVKDEEVDEVACSIASKRRGDSVDLPSQFFKR